MALPAISYECRVARDPELSFTKQGTPVLKLRTVASRATKTGNDWRTTAECWLDVVLWHDAETVFGQIAKGTLIHVAGSLQTREWQAKDGTKRSTVEVRAEVVAPIKRSSVQTAPLTAEAADPWAEVPVAVPDWSAGDAPF